MKTRRRSCICVQPWRANTHDKKATDDAQIAYPNNATLDKDTGFQGYEPVGTQTRQPQKSPKAKR